jgi:menaquinone-dependent protoporphyrinogen oxidase
MRVLVAYASKYGSVEEVARFVAERLEQHSIECEVVDAKDAVVGEHDAVVLGAGLYMGKMHKQGRRFLKRNWGALSHVPYAVFAMGPLSSEPEELEKVRPHLERGLRGAPEPVEAVVFGGVIDHERLHFPFDRMPEGDHRDWEAIAAFAERVAALAPVRV